MPESPSAMRREDVEREGVLERFHGRTELDREASSVLVEAGGPHTVDDVAAEFDWLIGAFHEKDDE